MYNKKETDVVIYLMNDMRLYIKNWEHMYYFFEFTLDEKIPNIWCMYVQTNTKVIIVVNSETKKDTSRYNETNKETFLKSIFEFRDANFKIIYKNVAYSFIGYLIDFFEYHVELPNKIEAADW